MMRDMSYGAIVYRRDKGIIYYLLLLYERNGKEWWDYPKGHAEDGETPLRAMSAELTEETGIKNFDVMEGFQEKEHFFFRENGELVSKTVLFFLVHTSEKEIHLSYEHKDAVWLPYEEALKKVTFDTAQNVLKKAHSFIAGNNPSVQRKLL